MLTVVMPAFKTESYVQAAVESVLAQDKVDAVVVVDDACPNGSGDAALIDDPRLTVLRMKENGGQYRAINTGIQWAEDHLDPSAFAILDSDDLACPGRFSSSLEALESSDVVSGYLQHIDENGALLSTVEGALLRENPAWTLRDRHAVVMYLPSMAMRREVIDELGGFEPTWGGADTQFFMRAFYAGYKMRMVPEVWTQYRQHANQVSRNLHMDPVRKAYHTKVRGEWAYWRMLKRNGRLRRDQVRVARIVGDAEVLVATQ